MSLNKIIAVVLGFGVLTVVLGKWVLLPLGIAIIILIIRLAADLFWHGKDKEWW